MEKKNNHTKGSYALKFAWGCIARCNKKIAGISLLAIVLSITACKKDTVKTDVNATGAANNSLKKVAAAPSLADATLAMTVYNDRFYEQYGTFGFSYKARYFKDESRTDVLDFWKTQEAIETAIDAYEVNPNNALKDKITYLFHGVIDRDGNNWQNNAFNDDLIWGALMCVRAWKITNNSGMLDAAKLNFKTVWDRGWDTNYNNGGIWWKNFTANETKTKNICVNAPAAICAMLLYQATGDAAYRDKAKQITDWMISKVYVSSTGEVKGAILPSGSHSEGATTYTQGTFIAACEMLRNDYPNSNYLQIALKAMDYARTNLTSGFGVLIDEDGLEDTQGFKSIFARWACKFVQNTNTRNNYGGWLDANASQAWAIRNSRGLMWNKWGQNTDNGTMSAFRTTCGVSMMNNVQRYQSSTQGQYIFNGTYKIVNKANNQVLDAKANGTANGTALDTWSYNGGNNQKWTLTWVGNGLYKIIGVGSGRAVNSSGNNNNNGSACQLWDFQNGANNSLVYLVPVPGAFLIVFAHSNKAIDLNTSNNTLTQWEINGGSNQQWSFQAP